MASLTAMGITGCICASSRDFALIDFEPRLVAMVLILSRVISLPARTEDWNALLPCVSTAMMGTGEKSKNNNRKKKKQKQKLNKRKKKKAKPRGTKNPSPPS